MRFIDFAERYEAFFLVITAAIAIDKREMWAMVLRFFTSNDFFSNIGLNVGLSFFFLIMFTLHIVNSGFYREPIEEKKTDVEAKQKEVLKLDTDPLQNK